MTDTSLDAPETYARLDPAGLYGRIAALPDQIAQAHAAATELALPEDYHGFESVAVLGMGGSGIGGSLLRALTIGLGSPIPVEIVRGYRLPAYIGPSTLAIASSNSGNTEEVLALFQQALAQGARCIALTTGGKLLALARQHATPTLEYAWEGEPRAALGWSFATLLAFCGRLGIVDPGAIAFDDALTDMRTFVGAIDRDVPEAANPAKRMARRLAGKLPVIVGAESMSPVAYRWRTQLNENAKTWAFAEELPEMNHNGPVGYGASAAIVQDIRVVLLRQQSAHARVLKRLELTREQMASSGLDVEVLDVPGKSLLSEMLWAIAFGDFASYYTGLLNGVDPSEVRALDWLKSRMART